MKRILFICTGNTCRSPMAEALLRARAPEPLRGELEISSAGTSTYDGMAASAASIKALAAVDVDISGHVARQITRQMAEEADLIIAMTRRHRADILRIAPGSERKILVLGELDPARTEVDIDDPIGGGDETYEAIRDEIDSLIRPLLDYLAVKFRITER